MSVTLKINNNSIEFGSFLFNDDSIDSLQKLNCNTSFLKGSKKITLATKFLGEEYSQEINCNSEKKVIDLFKNDITNFLRYVANKKSNCDNLESLDEEITIIIKDGNEIPIELTESVEKEFIPDVLEVNFDFTLPDKDIKFETEEPLEYRIIAKRDKEIKCNRPPEKIKHNTYEVKAEFEDKDAGKYIKFDKIPHTISTDKDEGAMSSVDFRFKVTDFPLKKKIFKLKIIISKKGVIVRLKKITKNVILYPKFVPDYKIEDENIKEEIYIEKDTLWYSLGSIKVKKTECEPEIEFAKVEDPKYKFAFSCDNENIEIKGDETLNTNELGENTLKPEISFKNIPQKDDDIIITLKKINTSKKIEKVIGNYKIKIISLKSVPLEMNLVDKIKEISEGSNQKIANIKINTIKEKDGSKSNNFILPTDYRLKISVKNSRQENLKVYFKNNSEDFNISINNIDQKEIDKVPIFMDVPDNPEDNYVLDIIVALEYDYMPITSREMSINVLRKIDDKFSVKLKQNGKEFGSIEKNGEGYKYAQKLESIDLFFKPSSSTISKLLTVEIVNYSETSQVEVKISNVKLQKKSKEDIRTKKNFEKAIVVKPAKKGTIGNGKKSGINVDYTVINEDFISELSFDIAILKDNNPVFQEENICLEVVFKNEALKGTLSLDFGTSGICAVWAPVSGEYSIIDLNKFSKDRNKYLIKKKEDPKSQVIIPQDFIDSSYPKIISSTLIYNDDNIIKGIAVENLEFKIVLMTNKEERIEFYDKQLCKLAPFTEEVEPLKQLPYLKSLISSQKLSETLIDRLLGQIRANNNSILYEMADTETYLKLAFNSLFNCFIQGNSIKDDEFVIDMKNLTDIVISIPNTFNKQHQDIMESAIREMVPRDNILFVRESSAVASVYYTCMPALNHKLLVYDMGAGTLDVAYFEKSEDKISLLAEIGLQTAGNYIDYVIYEILTKMADEKIKNVKPDNYNDAVELKKIIIKIKESLCQKNTPPLNDFLSDVLKDSVNQVLTYENTTFDGKTLNDIKEFNKEGKEPSIYKTLLNNLTKEVFEKMKTTMKSSDSTMEPDMVLLTGRASQLCGLKEIIEQCFKNAQVKSIDDLVLTDPNNVFDKSINLKSIVAYGSSYYKLLKKQKTFKTEINPPKFGFLYRKGSDTGIDYLFIDVDLTKESKDYELNNIYIGANPKLVFIKSYSKDPVADFKESANPDLYHIFTIELLDLSNNTTNDMKLVVTKQKDFEYEITSDSLDKDYPFSINKISDNSIFRKSMWPYL